MARVASGVSVVTTDGPAGRAGLTISAMCSLSADPPAVLVCINRASHAGRIIRINGVFCVNVLASHQADIARRFAGQVGARGDKFFEIEWDRLGTGLCVPGRDYLDRPVDGRCPSYTYGRCARADDPCVLPAHAAAAA